MISLPTLSRRWITNIVEAALNLDIYRMYIYLYLISKKKRVVSQLQKWILIKNVIIL